jgi:hypothetical protein
VNLATPVGFLWEFPKIPRQRAIRAVGRQNKQHRTRRRQEKESRLKKAALVATIIGMLIAAAAFAYDRLEGSGSAEVPAKTPQLERIDLIARNGLPPHRPALELLVHNGGRGRSVVSRAQIKIVKVYPLPLCFTQGELPLSKQYGVQLPEDSEPGDVVEVPIHQQIPGDQADRFLIDLGVAPADPESDSLEGLYLFEVEVSLLHDGTAPPLPMGKALVSLDEPPFTTEYVLREGEFARVEREYGAGGPARQTWATQLPCWQANARELLRAESSQATRSQQLQAIMDGVVIPSLSEVDS